MLTAMRIYIMRHGRAEDRSSSGRDEDRSLTSSGRKGVTAVARLLMSEGDVPQRILTSRLLRALQTGEIVAAAAKGSGWLGVPEATDDLAPDGDSVALVRQLQAGSDLATMLVGHEPDLSTLVVRLTDRPMPMPMDKAMVVAVDLHRKRAATLRFILEPRSLAYVFDNRRG
jgi:phosphohistidine phosphatase